jgi:hypothetical protein
MISMANASSFSSQITCSIQDITALDPKIHGRIDRPTDIESKTRHKRSTRKDGPPCIQAAEKILAQASMDIAISVQGVLQRHVGNRRLVKVQRSCDEVVGSSVALYL